MVKPDKISAWMNVLTHLILVDGLLRLTAFVMFPIAYCLRWMGKVNPLWIYLEDDTDCLGVPQERINSKVKFFVAYNECVLRNPTDNLNQWLMRNKKGAYENVSYEYCETYNYMGMVPRIDNTPNALMLRAKFFNDPNNPDDVHNVGKYLSFKHSYFGRKLYYYQQGGRWYVLYSHCWIDSFKDGIYTVKERNIGASDRILVRRKTQTAQ